MSHGSARIPIASVDIGEPEIAAAVRVLRSGHLRQGSEVAHFESAFARRVGAKHAVAVSSGTAALHIAWLALLDPGDEVIVPTFTFIATASAVALAGGHVRFCDVDPTDGTISVKSAASVLTSRTRGIAPVHLYGGVCDVNAVRGLAERYGLRIVWDAAQAHGSQFQDRDVGSIGDMCCYSFYPSKNMTTGEGGMVTTGDDGLAAKLRLLRSHGQASKYHHVLLGYNYRMTDFQAAIGVEQLASLDARVARRRANASGLSAMLAGLPGIRTPVEQSGCQHSFHQYTIAVDSEVAGIDRDTLGRRLLDDGIESAVHYPTPLHRQPVFETERRHTGFPISERLSQQVLSLPVHPGLTDEDTERIGLSVRRAVGG
jgi:perosamine synthetase